MSDPVSWLVIEPGWKVFTSEGVEIGKVQEVVGDTGKDIFDGLTISAGLLGKTRYVAAERVRAITEGVIELDLDEGAAARLPEYEEPPPSEAILPTSASIWERLAGLFRGR